MDKDTIKKYIRKIALGVAKGTEIYSDPHFDVCISLSYVDVGNGCQGKEVCKFYEKRKARSGYVRRAGTSQTRTQNAHAQTQIQPHFKKAILTLSVKISSKGSGKAL